MWRIQLNQFLILFMAVETLSSHPLFGVPLEGLAANIDHQIYGAAVQHPAVPDYYYLRETGNGDKLGTYLIGRKLLKDFNNEEFTSKQSELDKVEMPDDVETLDEKSTNPEENHGDQNQQRLSKQFFYRIYPQPQQQLLAYQPYHAPIHQFYQPSRLIGLQQIVPDYSNQFYNPQKYVLQPAARVNNPVVSFIHQTQHIPTHTSFSLFRKNPNIFVQKNLTPADNTETSENATQEPEMRSSAEDNKSEQLEYGMKGHKNCPHDKELADVKLHSDDSTEMTEKSQSMELIEKN